jgi:fibronectin-binding autotransporter adhesin
MRFFHSRFLAIAAALAAFCIASSSRGYERRDDGILDNSDNAFTFAPSSFNAGPAWLIDAVPGYSSSRARQMFYLSLERSGDSRLSLDYSGGTSSTSSYVYGPLSSNSLARVPIVTDARSSGSGGTSLAPAATTYNWNFNGTSATSNDWSNGASWTPNIIGGPDLAGDVAIINNDITGNRVITLFLTGDSGNAVKTVGRLDIGDSNGTHSFTITTGSGAGILEFDSGDATPAQLNNLVTANATRIGAPIQLKTDLTVTNLSTNVTNSTLTLGGTAAGGITSSATSGTQTLTINTSAGGVLIGGAATAVIADGSTGGHIALAKEGTGLLEIQTATNTYSGGTFVNGGVLSFNQSGSLGAGTVTLGKVGGGNAQLTSSNTTASPTNNIIVTSGTGGTSTLGSTSTGTTGGTIYSGTITLNGDVTATSSYAGTAVLTFSNSVSGVGGLTKVGTGPLVLSGNNSYSGATQINAGTLNAGAAGALGSGTTGTSGITVNAGGTLLLSGSNASTDRINNNAGVKLVGSGSTTGGTFNTGGLSEGIRPSSPSATDGVAGMGALTLQTTSATSMAVIDFTNGNSSSLVFSSLSGGSGAFVNVLNWTGTANTDLGTATNDRLLFAADPGLTLTDLANWQFFNDSGTAFAVGGTIIPYGNQFELVPVPEPSTWTGAALALGAVGWMGRKLFAKRT